jgi:tetraacyldisaccharide 4'-kinase
VSVGNVAVGGSGKTPVVATLARLLQDRGEHPAILSRGYARQRPANGVVMVGDGERILAPACDSGDEPQMLARALPGVVVAVAPDRYLAGCLAERRFGATVHLLDDGFQHLQLARDVDLVVMSPADLDEQVLPAGRLREPVESARAADAVLVTGEDGLADAVGQRLGIEHVFQLRMHYNALRPLIPDPRSPIPETGSRVLAVAGIARPERFFSALAAHGWEVVGRKVFRDHHWFTPRDIEDIERAAVDARADLIVTTEKDAVRLDVTGRTATWTFLPLRVTIEPADRFERWFAHRLATARGGGQAA